MERSSGPATGDIEFVEEKKGYGVVSRSEGDGPFVHRSATVRPGLGVLATGRRVRLDVSPGRSGDEARGVLAS